MPALPCCHSADIAEPAAATRLARRRFCLHGQCQLVRAWRRRLVQSTIRAPLFAARTLLKCHRSNPGHSIAAVRAIKSRLWATAGAKGPKHRPKTINRRVLCARRSLCHALRWLGMDELTPRRQRSRSWRLDDREGEHSNGDLIYFIHSLFSVFSLGAREVPVGRCITRKCAAVNASSVACGGLPMEGPNVHAGRLSVLPLPLWSLRKIVNHCGIHSVMSSGCATCLASCVFMWQN